MNLSITLIIVVVTALVSIAADNNRSLKEKLLFNPYLVNHSKQNYRIFTHAFIHSGWLHLIVNMWVLYIFGQFVENEFNTEFESSGRLYFISLYLGGVFFASLSALIKHKDNPRYNSLGASGAVAAVLYAFIIMRPTQPIYLYFMIGLPSFIFGILYLFYEYSMGKRGRSRIAHDAHFFGALFGIIFMALVNFDYVVECGKDIQFYIASYFV